MKKIRAFIVLTLLVTASEAHEYLNAKQLAARWQWDFENTEVQKLQVGAGLHVLFGVGGNVLVSVGEQAVRELGGERIDFIITTHWHFDHADGNPILGAESAWIVTYANSRKMMAGEHLINLVELVYLQPAYPSDAMPVITYTGQMRFHINGNNIDLLHFGPAHTTGDTAVFFSRGQCYSYRRCV